MNIWGYAVNENSTWRVFPRIAACMWRLLVLFFCLSASLEAVGLRVVSYNVGAHLTNGGNPGGPYYFDYGLGDSATIDHTAVRDVLARIDADVVALQEVHMADLSGNPDDLDALAASLGLPHVYVPVTTGDIDNSFVVVFLSRYPFLNVDDVRSPSGAKELTRNFPVVQVDVPGTNADPWLVSGHLKSGSGNDDRLRRAVEMERLSKYFEDKGITDDDPYILLGDFNPSGSPATYNSPPSGLPGSFVLGPDITYPITYSTDMRSYFTSVSPALLDPRQLDGSDATFQSGSTLDLLMVSPRITAHAFAVEVYNSALDSSNSTGLPKTGSPLAASVSLDASDHYAVFADLELVETPPYAFANPSDSVSENFDGFSGLRDPLMWSSDTAFWIGEDDGSSPVAGARSFGEGVERAPGFILSDSEQSLAAEFENQASVPITVLDLSYFAEQWRASLGGSLDRIEVDLLHGGSVTRLTDLDFDSRSDLPTGLVSGGDPVERFMRVGGLSIEPDESFTLEFRFVPGLGIQIVPADVFINEFHYDNTGADQGEFVEIVVGPGYEGDLSDVVLTFYNGGDQMADSSHSLDSFDLGTTTACNHRVFSKMISGIQNGSPDGFALVVDGVVTSFLSYEGNFLSVDGPAIGMTSTDVGVSQGTSEPVGTNAIGLVGMGGSSGDFVWQKISGSHSPGAVNAGQILELSGLPPQGLAIDDLVVIFVQDTDGDGVADDEDGDDDNDGQSDDFELAFGSDPLNAASVFKTSLSSTPGDYGLTFPAANGVLYTVEWCDDLVSWETLSIHLGEGEEIEVLLPSGESKAFFRVKAGG